MGKSSKIKLGSHAKLWSFSLYVKNLAILMRPTHWVKNLFLYIPLFFSGTLFDLDQLASVTMGVFAFCLVASGEYILNDYMDADKDRLHPLKKHRPMASGMVSVSAAFALMAVCLLSGLAVGWLIGLKFFVILFLYAVINVAYSLGLKNVAILDIFILAAGFMLRIKGGGVIASIGISQWLMVMVFLLALFMALGKRRDDVLLKRSSGKETRHSLSGYNLDFLNVSLALVSAIIIVAYLMYTLSDEVIIRLGTYRLYYTGFFVIAGLMRYLQLIYVKKQAGSPTRIVYKDRFVQACLLLWGLSFYFLIYYPDLHFPE